MTSAFSTGPNREVGVDNDPKDSAVIHDVLHVCS